MTQIKNEQGQVVYDSGPTPEQRVIKQLRDIADRLERGEFRLVPSKNMFFMEMQSNVLTRVGFDLHVNNERNT